ncbi:MAG: homocysteine S-methyltransferase family protein [Actinobacteria bacterium]|nr:homocysteine S-methyltransferase family protein [Actinomycetota bacterium]
MDNNKKIVSNGFFKVLEEKILICDGAMGTMLQSRGISGCPDSLNLDKKPSEPVMDIHFGYLKAGSDIIQTNTFGSNPVKLGACGLEKSIKEINRNAVLNARKAVELYRKDPSYDGRPLFIAGDIGPLGQLLEPSGSLKYSRACDSFCRQVEILAENGVDLLLVETIMDLNEALAAIEAAGKVAPGLPLACTMTFGKNAVTIMGNKAADSLKAVIEAGCDIAGANCSVGSDSMLEMVRSMREADSSAKLMFQPNAGLPVIVDGVTTYNETPRQMADNIKKYLAYKPSILGACCGSTPEHIRMIAALVR